MRIISFIEDESVIKKILSHLNLWLPQYHDPPDYPVLCYPSADNTDGGSSSLPDIECGNLQLDLFSSRCYEWLEAGNKLNAKNTMQKSSEELPTFY